MMDTDVVTIKQAETAVGIVNAQPPDGWIPWLFLLSAMESAEDEWASIAACPNCGEGPIAKSDLPTGTVVTICPETHVHIIRGRITCPWCKSVSTYSCQATPEYLRVGNVRRS